jgi:hypothetical protein
LPLKGALPLTNQIDQSGTQIHAAFLEYETALKENDKFQVRQQAGTY